ncbi:MAG TPA: HIT family hydrolase [Ktedonobacter sp.]|nr:HIT family hydrolase [Ktedonobacter sp.]
MEDCIFCKIINRQIPAYILDENEDVVTFLSLENHPLVVPKRHIPNIYSLDDRSASAVMVEAVKIAKAVKEGVRCDGVNLVQANEPAANQDVFHFHLHIKPRWYNDTVILHWNTTKVSPEKLQESMELIKRALR